MMGSTGLLKAMWVSMINPLDLAAPWDYTEHFFALKLGLWNCLDPKLKVHPEKLVEDDDIEAVWRLKCPKYAMRKLAFGHTWVI